MTELDPPDELPRASRRKTLWPSLIWAMPLLALIIVIYLSVQWVEERGEIVTVTFATAGGARAGETKVMYQGVEAGHLIKIMPNKDGRRLDFKLRLIPEAKAGLNSNARFYLIGASPTLDLNSLRAVVAGVAIGYAPGTGGTPADTFEGLNSAPIVFPGDRGTRYVLTTRSLGQIREGAILLYRGESIGKVSAVSFVGESQFRLQLFVFAPYDALIKAGDRFWKTSPLRLSFGGGGVNANLAPLSTFFSGGMELDMAAADAQSGQSPEGSEFTLYSSLSAARQGLSGPTVPYTFNFEGTAGGLDESSAVTLLGFQIGEVQTARLAYDAASGKPFTAVTALIYPQQLDAKGSASTADSRSASDAKVRQLIRFGYRARLEQSPPIVGSTSIALVQVKGGSSADLIQEGTVYRIPSAAGAADLADLSEQADQILTKINHLPIEQIGENLRIITDTLRSVVSSPKVKDGLAHLDSSLAQFDHMLTEVEPQMGPLIATLNQAARQISAIALAAHQLLDGDGAAQDNSLPEAIRQLNEAARSVRTLADFLDRHPEALIRGKKAPK